jgi:cell division protein FtsL
VSAGWTNVARGRRGKSKTLFTWLLLLACAVLAGASLYYGSRARQLEAENRDLRKKIQQHAPAPDKADLEKKIQQLQKEIEAKDQQIGDLEIRLKIYEKGSVKK